MKKTIIILIAIIAITTTATAQQNIADKAWTNGDMEYRVQSKGNVFLFYGHDRNEGGFGFALTKRTDGKMYISEIQNEEVAYYCFEQYLNSTVEYKLLKGQELLFVRNQKNAIIDIFIVDNLQNISTTALIRYLAGSYTDANGKNYVFNANATRASGFGTTEQYTFDERQFVPDFIISFGNDKSYRITRKSGVNEVRLHFEPYMKDNYDEWQPSKTGQSFTLTKKTWDNNVADKNIQGRYPFTSSRVMTRGELILFTNDELDIMRNEIFARHGHIFKTARYRDYFNTQSWYKATVNDATSNLSEIERLNVEQIKAVQDIIKNAN